MRVKCRTLFDITKTNVSSRRQRLETGSQADIEIPRKQQANFETLLQVIGLRKQPENISDPHVVMTTTDLCGTKHKRSIKVWEFEFTFVHYEVLTIAECNIRLDNILTDCVDVPMLTGLGESDGVDNKLITSGPKKNIEFILVEHESLV